MGQKKRKKKLQHLVQHIFFLQLQEEKRLFVGIGMSFCAKFISLRFLWEEEKLHGVNYSMKSFFSFLGSHFLSKMMIKHVHILLAKHSRVVKPFLLSLPRPLPRLILLFFSLSECNRNRWEKGTRKRDEKRDLELLMRTKKWQRSCRKTGRKNRVFFLLLRRQIKMSSLHVVIHAKDLFFSFVFLDPRANKREISFFLVSCVRKKLVLDSFSCSNSSPSSSSSMRLVMTSKSPT